MKSKINEKVLARQERASTTSITLKAIATSIDIVERSNTHLHTIKPAQPDCKLICTVCIYEYACVKGEGSGRV